MIKRLSTALLGATLAFAALAQAALSEGEVRKVDPANGKITLRHGEIKNLDMPPMTMVFAVRDKALLAGIQAGDRIRFTAEQAKGGQLVVTSIETQQK